ncbi:hypothetical protein Tco_0882432 [Tanacetum coccineum]
MAIPDEEGDGHSREVIRVEEAAPKDPTRDSKSTSVEENEDVSKPGKGKGETSKEATGHKKGSVNEKMVDTTRSTWNEDLESDDEVDEDIFPDGNKWDDQFDIRLKGRVRK